MTGLRGLVTGSRLGAEFSFKASCPVALQTGVRRWKCSLPLSLLVCRFVCGICPYSSVTLCVEYVVTRLPLCVWSMSLLVCHFVCRVFLTRLPICVWSMSLLVCCFVCDVCRYSSVALCVEYVLTRLPLCVWSMSLVVCRFVCGICPYSSLTLCAESLLWSHIVCRVSRAYLVPVWKLYSFQLTFPLTFPPPVKKRQRNTHRPYSNIYIHTYL